MVLTLYGSPSPFSTCTQRVAVVLKEKGIPFDLKYVTNADLATEDYAEHMQPFRQFPVLDDDGYKLYESRAIGRYIALKYADQGTQGLIPDGKDLKELADFEKAMSIEAAQFITAELLTIEVAVKPFHGEQPNDETVKRLTQQLNRKLDGYERILSKHKYLSGDYVTLADLFHLPFAYKLESQISPRIMTTPDRPNVQRWYKDISSRESWLTVKDGLNVQN